MRAPHLRRRSRTCLSRLAYGWLLVLALTLSMLLGAGGVLVLLQRHQPTPQSGVGIAALPSPTLGSTSIPTRPLPTARSLPTPRPTAQQRPTRTPLALRPTARPPLSGMTPTRIPSITPESAALGQPGHLRVHVIDVGQGDSLLIEAPDGARALLDGGYDNGRALAYLQARGITQLDAVIISHPHADHIGGLTQVIEALKVDAVWSSGAVHYTSYYEDLLDAIDRRRVPYREVSAGESIPLGALELRVLFAARDAANLNNTSLVLRLDHGAISFLLTGDAEAPVEQQLLRERPADLRATILKVPHHGSNDSSSAGFLAAVRPEVAIYSAALNNSYGHPHGETVERLRASGAQIYGTAEHGSVVVISDGAGYQIETLSGLAATPAPGYDATPQRPASQLSPTPDDSGECDPSYPDVCIPPSPPDLNCGDVPYTNIRTIGRDPHNFDGDGDGVGCER